jgi:hypothetical protein
MGVAINIRTVEICIKYPRPQGMIISVNLIQVGPLICVGSEEAN